MTRRVHALTCFCTIFLGGCAASHPADRGAAPAAEHADANPPGFSLTVYSTADPATFSPQELLQSMLANRSGDGGTFIAPGYGIVREVRRMQLKKGTSRVEFTDVASGIDPTTVAFRSLTAPDSTSVLEQNFEYDLTGADKLLGKFLGKQVAIHLKRSDGPSSSGAEANRTPIRGKLLSFETNGYGIPVYVVQTEDGHEPIVIQRGEMVESIRLADAGTGLISKPTLNWKVDTDHPGPHDVQVTYQTDGLTWRADYNLVLSAENKSADLSAWVTLLNGSGRAYPDTRLKLVAGNVQRYELERSRASGGGGGLFGGSSQAKEGFTEKGLFEYHLYTLGRATSLPNNSTKQIELFPSRSAIATEEVFVYYGLSEKERSEFLQNPQTDRSFGTDSNPQVDVYMRLKNSEANHLGLPLPAGKVRLYKVDEADHGKEFIGEDIIRHTPKDEELMLRLGSAFDIVGERRQTDFQEDPHNATETFEIVLRNRKTQAVQVIVKENLYRWFNWEIKESSDPWKKQDSRTIHLPVEVPANGEKKLTYKVHYWW